MVPDESPRPAVLPLLFRRSLSRGASLGLILALSACIPNPYRDEAGYPAPPPAQGNDYRRDDYRRDDYRPNDYRPNDYRAGDPRFGGQPADEKPYPGTRDYAEGQPGWRPATAIVADARTVAEGSYVVQPGDTLRGIAARTGAGSEAIARANGLEPPFIIRAGETLRIPAGRYHLVREGETGLAIARAYRVPWADIIAANALEEPYVIRAGMRLIVPGTEPVVAAPAGTPRPDESLAARAASFRVNIDDVITGSAPAEAEYLPEPSTVPPLTTTPRPPLVRPPTQTPAVPPLAGGFGWPVPRSAGGQIVGRFGPVASGEKNEGIKIAVPIGTSVLAAANGVVAYDGSEVPMLGGVVMIRHADGWFSVYGHLSQILVGRDQMVRKGQAIGISGDSGRADRPLLHFELRKGRTPVNPLTQVSQP